MAGLIIGAAAASGIWLLFGNEEGSAATVSAPERIGEYYRFDKVPDPGSEGRHQKVADRYARYDRESSARLSAAHDGAGAVVAQYTTEDLDSMFSLEVVRTRSPFPPYVPYSDPEDLGVDKPIEEVLRYGDVACAVRNNPSQPPIVMACLRTAGDLTVTISRVSGDMGQQPEDVAKLVDDAWSDLR
ncbi:MAG: hypothetical protein WBA97_26240 [Actinophytocola sp.]|uniref:hypothetical protein n=1 Tax=Actinophytocola sp. TaxID=1872138 RepID=UPI003C75B837